MANKGITKQQVWEICDLMHSQGVEPTITKIKDKLGTGSFTTISNHLGSWKQGEADKDSTNLKAIPRTVEEDLMKMASRMWNICSLEAEKDMAKLKADYNDEITIAKEEVNKISLELRELLKKLDESDKDIEKLEKEKALLEKELIKQTARNDANEELLKKLNK